MFSPKSTGVLSITQAQINLFDKAISRTRIVPVDGVVVEGGFGGLDLFERHSLALQILDPVADDCHHVLVVRKVRGVTDPSVTRNEQRALLRHVSRKRQIDEIVQSVDEALNGAALLEIDDWIIIPKQITSTYYVRATEPDDAVAIRVRRRHMNYLDRVTIRVR